MAPEVQDLSFLQNWNSAEEFLEGAEYAHKSVLGTLWQPSSTPISQELRESLGPDALQWLTDSRSGSSDGTLCNAVVAARFESFEGPESLEHIRRMDALSLGSLRDPERLSAFSRDTWQGSPLRLVVAAVSEAHCERSSRSEGASAQHIIRRADRIHLTCDFNLREGIASAFSVARVEELLVEEDSAYSEHR